LAARTILRSRNAIEVAEHAGIDLSLAEESLRLTPEQRALQHQSALEMALQLETAYRASMNKHDRCSNNRKEINSPSTAGLCSLQDRHSLHPCRSAQDERRRKTAGLNGSRQTSRESTAAKAKSRAGDAIRSAFLSLTFFL